MDLVKLHALIDGNFNDDEIRDLCFQIGLDYDGISGENKSGKTRELITYCKRRGKLLLLTETVFRVRPHLRSEADWNGSGAKTTENANTTKSKPDASSSSTKSSRNSTPRSRFAALGWLTAVAMLSKSVSSRNLLEPVHAFLARLRSSTVTPTATSKDTGIAVSPTAQRSSAAMFAYQFDEGAPQGWSIKNA